MKTARQEADFAHSLADLMSGVAVVFLVVAAIFMVQASQASRKARQQQLLAEQLAEKNKIAASKYEQLDKRDQEGIQEIENLRQSLASNKNIDLEYDPKKDPRLLTIVFNRDNLRFAPGECTVAPEMQAVLQATLRDIFPQICATAGAGLEKTITLEGHTDNSPPFGGNCGMVVSADEQLCSEAAHLNDERCKDESFENNVRLSAARAQFVFFQARDALRENQAVAQCLDRNFLVAGRGPMEPLDGRPWDEPRSDAENARNRRVVIKVRVTVASVAARTP